MIGCDAPPRRAVPETQSVQTEPGRGGPCLESPNLRMARLHTLQIRQQRATSNKAWTFAKKSRPGMNSPLSWDEFRLVKAIADARSLVGAADGLGLNHSTIFRRLGAVEEALGTRLFERSRSGYQPTAAGEEMVALATTMSDSFVEFERRVAGRDVKPAANCASRPSTQWPFICCRLFLRAFGNCTPACVSMLSSPPIN
jgi:molybdenum-dependent DNA-binding transcriptional regulator ModE